MANKRLSLTDKESILDYKYLSSIITYNEDTGEFLWKTDRHPMKQGDIAGTLDNRGYRRIKINDRVYLAHRLAWFIVHKRWPERHVDHVDKDPLNNSITNLRDVPHSVNMKNQPIRKDSPHRISGITTHGNNKYRAKITVDYKQIQLGIFTDFFEACCARKSAENKYNFL